MGFLDKAKQVAQQAADEARKAADAVRGRPSTPTAGPGGANAGTAAPPPPPGADTAPTAHSPTQSGLPEAEGAPASSPQATDAQAPPPPSGPAEEAGDDERGG